MENNAQQIQDNIFKKMTASQKVKLVSQFFRFAKKLNSLNDRKIIKQKNGNRGFIGKNIKNT